MSTSDYLENMVYFQEQKVKLQASRLEQKEVKWEWEKQRVGAHLESEKHSEETRIRKEKLEEYDALEAKVREFHECDALIAYELGVKLKELFELRGDLIH